MFMSCDTAYVCLSQARNVDIKQVWMLELKRRLLDSYAAAVPMKVFSS